MGREIRRVPADWQHPRDEMGNYQPMHDEPFILAARQWLDDCIAWDRGDHPDLLRDPSLKEQFPFFWQWDTRCPDPEYFRPEFGSEATWLQVYETVSEGTPVTPPFPTREELIQYLVDSGDFWDQKRGDGGWKREAAEAFVASGWAPSLDDYSPRGF